LAAYHSLLRSDLVDLINRNSADFINLATNLVGVDGIIDGIRDEVQGNRVRGEVETVKNSVSTSISRLRDKLDRLDEVREKK
ncbi:Conserved oligomeric Golgi complex subunit 2, partial [Gonapodya sp. JEL0774]